MTSPSLEYRLFFTNQNIGAQSILADGFEHDNGLMVFYVTEQKGERIVAGINARAIATFTIQPYDGTEVMDPGPALRDSDAGWDPDLISPGNPYVRSLHVGEPKSTKTDPTKPFEDPFRGGKLREKR